MFHDQAACETGMGRVFDICHGYRRCVSLCQSFPTLFDLVDATADGEVHGVAKKDFRGAVDQCDLCDLCYLTKCPYVAPHPWNLGFPHTMLGAKGIKFRNGEVGAGEKLLASTDTHGQFAGIPMVVQVVNALNKTKPVRKLLDAALRVHREGWLPELASQRFRWGFDKDRGSTPIVNGERTPGKVVIFSTCYVNYNEPGIGFDMIKVLRHNGIEYTVVEKESCCGMPQLVLGDLDGVEMHKDANIPLLAKYARDGCAIPTAIPSCTLIFMLELPLLVPGEADVALVQKAMFDPFEYLRARHKDGLLKLDFKAALGKVSCHIPCHGRVQKIGKKTEEVFKLIGQTVTVQLNTVERCSGHASTYGVKTAYFDKAMKIGKPVFNAMAKDEPDYISSDCALAGHHIAQGMARNALPVVQLAHPLSQVRIAYALE